MSPSYTLPSPLYWYERVYLRERNVKPLLSPAEVDHIRNSRQRQQHATSNQKPSKSNQKPSKLTESRPQRQPATTTTMGALIHYFFMFVKLTHHLRNWTSTPSSLRKKATQFCADLHPPSASDKLRESYNATAEMFLDRIQTLTYEHLLSELESLHPPSTKTLTKQDIESAKREAATRLKNTYRRKLSSQDMDHWLNDAAKDIFIEPLHSVPAAKTNETLGASIETTNPFSILDEDTESKAMETGAPEPHPGSKRTRADSSDRRSVSDTPKKQKSSSSPPSAQFRGRTTTVTSTPVNSAPTASAIPHSAPGSHKADVRTIVAPSGLRHSAGYRVNTGAMNTETVIIGDSNLRVWKDYPDNWTVICHPGLRLSRALDLINKSVNDIPPNVKEIIITSGILDIGGTRLDEMNIHDLLHAIRKRLDEKKIQLYLLGTAISPQMGVALKEKIGELNDLCRDVLGDYFIQPPVEYKVYYKDDHTHYNETTGTILIKTVFSFLAAQ